MDGMLTQEEIDALTGGNNSDSSTQQASEISESLTDAERDAVGEIANINMGTAATTLSTLLNNKVTITTPRVSYVTLNELSAQYDRPCVFIHISYISGIDGNNILILKEHDVKVITDLMMGGDGTNTASLVDLNDTIEDTELSNFLDGDIVQVAFDMKIGDLVDSQIMQLYPFDFARELYKKFMGSEVEQTAAPASQPEQPQPVSPAPEPVPTPAPQPVQPQPVPQQMQQPQYAMPMPNVNVQSAQFQTFNTGVSPLMQEENIDLVLDVPLEVTVELGRTNKSIKEILDFSPGTIIELDKLAGEPVDVLVNGKFVAKGEVVVIEENFGIRLVEISK